MSLIDIPTNYNMHDRNVQQVLELFFSYIFNIFNKSKYF